MIRYLPIFILTLILSSCSNITPLYKQDHDLKSKLSSIEIEEIDTINGSEIYHNLVKLIGESKDTNYLLKIYNCI
jgi:hypothetical protein